MEKPIASHSEEMRTTTAIATARATTTATCATSAANVPQPLVKMRLSERAALTHRMIYPGRVAV